MERIYGYIERITFQNEDNGYTVAKLKEPNKRDLTVVIGNMPGIQPGETVSCQGTWKRHLVHGVQFEVDSFTVEMPADLVGIEKYLSSGLVKGIGPTYAKRIVECFGTSTLTVIDSEPNKLLDINGIGKKRIEKITSCWSDQKTIRDIMMFLQKFQISPSFAQKIFKTYGASSIETVTKQPYKMARDIRGIGFKSADTIAQRMGFSLESPQRIEAGLEHVLFELSNEGNVCYPLNDLLSEAEPLLSVDRHLLQASAENLFREERMIAAIMGKAPRQTLYVWNTSIFRSETGIVRESNRLLSSPSALRKVDVEKALTWVQQQLNLELATNQIDAVTKALEDKMLIITGGPGTGKSTITNAILKITEKLTNKILLAAPTGRAAKRMTEITGRKSSTIHALLEFDFKKFGFKKNRENPLDCDLIIIDEASMIDTHLMNQLLRAIPSRCRVILVGDIHQLPSVGPGNVLKDMILSKKMPVIILDHIFRQAADSQIITNAHKINQGTFPSIRNDSSSDFFFLEQETPEDVLETVVNIVSTRLPNKYGLNPIDDIQVLAPMKRGVIGTENLNFRLQDRLNPSKNPLMRAGRRFHVNDKVMQLRNDYQKEVFNGDVGRITKINLTDQVVKVMIDEREIEYDFSDLDDLIPAYAVSIHKSQGSEYPCVVIPVHTQHFKLLHRNLLYTGVTRGKKLVVLVGTQKALGIAVRNDDVKRRYTGLQEALSLPEGVIPLSQPKNLMI